MSDTQDVFRTETEGAVLIVIPVGDHVGFQMTEIEQETGKIVDLLERAESSQIVFDAGEAAYLSSTVIGAMIRMWDAVSGQGGRFVTCGLSEDALTAIAVTRLDAHWPSFDSRAEALEALLSGD